MAAESNGGCEVEEVLPRSGHIAVAAENYMIVWGGYQVRQFYYPEHGISSVIEFRQI